MPRIRGAFTFQRGGPGYTEDWNGNRVLFNMAEAARRALNDATKMAKAIAETEHEWLNQTGQEEVSVYREEATLERGAAGPHVFAEWGVRPDEREPPSLVKGSGQYPGGPLTTETVAMFLEFGTTHAQAYPWLYPAFDESKMTIMPNFLAYYKVLAAMNSNVGGFRIKGRFTSPAGFEDMFR